MTLTHSPLAGSFPRVVPAGGETIDSRPVPAGTVVGVHQFATNVSPRNFARPRDFCPERWLDGANAPGSEFARDNRAAYQPFAVGPRGCVGRSLAMASLRVVLARLVWNFDLELAAESREWIAAQKIFLNWEKPALMVRLVPREGARVAAAGEKAVRNADAVLGAVEVAGADKVGVTVETVEIGAEAAGVAA